MTVRQMHHVGVVVEDLPAAIAFFEALGLVVEGRAGNEGEDLDRIIGVAGARTEFAMLATPDGHGRLELIRFLAPPMPEADPRAPSDVPGLRHLTFEVDDLDATLAALRPHGAEPVGDVVSLGGYRLCYLRGPAGVILEVAEVAG